MKSLTLSSRFSLAVALFCIASCGGKKGTDTTANDSTAKNATAAANSKPSTIINTPQNMMIVTHKVANFNKWQASYDAHDSMRVASGTHNYVIGRGLKDSNTLLVAVKVDDLNKAKAFAKDPGLKQAMQKGGVVGKPLIDFTTMTFQDTATISSDLRSRTTFTVKDWDKWQRSFDSSRQMRADNGLMDRAYGHNADDNHKVTVVVALLDTAKAYAFWKSDQLKKLQQASGVTSKPERFIYRVVKRY
ncbi:hypothetical protein [Segetibacter koreensis]|uniref:hypothetical protein n=1 Tax=Segetibacter koreensis TaxID=398037 RepID=UPI00036A546C|nr:hypothetical protein [Segetibacter koreensis]